jgi:hypothetical protein
MVSTQLEEVKESMVSTQLEEGDRKHGEHPAGGGERKHGEHPAGGRWWNLQPFPMWLPCCGQPPKEGNVLEKGHLRGMLLRHMYVGFTTTAGVRSDSLLSHKIAVL